MHVVLVGPDSEENLSLGYLSASLHTAGHECTTVAFTRRADAGTVVAATADAAIVGLSMAFQVRAREFLALAREIKIRRPDCMVVAGGHYASCAARELLTHHNEIDLIVIHEGEQTLVDIADRVANSEHSLADIPGVAYRAGTDVVFSPPRRRATDLDVLPYPDRTGALHLAAGIPTAYIVGSRGCLSSCDYCCISTLHRLAPGPRFRQRAPERVADEMAMLYHQRGIRQFVFHDDNFLVPSVDRNHRRLDSLESALAERGVEDFAFSIKCRPADANPDVFARLKHMGLIRVFLGIESASQEGLASIGRRQSMEESESALALCNDLGISAQFTVMIFNPDATVATVRNDIAFMRRYAMNPQNFVRAELYAGTCLEQRMIDEGRAEGDYLARYYHLTDAAADRACTVSKQLFHSRCWGPDNLMSVAIRLDHLSMLLERFYSGTEIDPLRQAARSFLSRVNTDTINRLESLVDLCTDTPDYSDAGFRRQIESMMRYERESRERFVAEELRLRRRIDELTYRQLGLTAEREAASRHRSDAFRLARHSAAAILALSLAGGVVDVWAYDPAPPPLEEDYDGDGLCNHCETEIFGTAYDRADSNGNGIPDGEEDHDGDGLTNDQEQRNIVALLDAAESGDAEKVLELIEYEEYVNLVSYHGYGVLEAAAVNGHADVIRVVMDNVEDFDDLAQRNHEALFLASQGGHTEAVRALLEKWQNLETQGWYRQTALDAARSGGHTEIVDMLIEAGAVDTRQE